MKTNWNIIYFVSPHYTYLCAFWWSDRRYAIYDRHFLGVGDGVMQFDVCSFRAEWIDTCVHLAHNLWCYVATTALAALPARLCAWLTFALLWPAFPAKSGLWQMDTLFNMTSPHTHTHTHTQSHCHTVLYDLSLGWDKQKRCISTSEQLSQSELYFALQTVHMCVCVCVHFSYHALVANTLT